MSRLLIALSVSLVCSVLAAAQKLPYKRIDSLDKRPIVMVNGKIVDPLSFFALDKRDFQYIRWVRPEVAVLRFGEADGKFGAVEITLLKQAKTLSWDDLLKKFHFTKTPDSIKCAMNVIIGSTYLMNAPRLLISSPLQIRTAAISSMSEQRFAFVIQSTYYYSESYKIRSQIKRIDDEMEFISRIFDNESMQRAKIRGNKITIRG